MADSSNSSATSSTSSQSTGSQSTGSQASTSGATTSNSTGNFSGGLPGLGGGSWGSPSSETSAAHASGVEGPGLANGDFGSSWSGNGNSGSGSGDYTYNNTSYSNNKSEPVMTVDEVYGKTETTGISGNQSIVEGQGDYAASSNEESGVETSTFGKQDNIAVTPESVTENKGLVDNAAIDSIEGLNFQQKDKESQDVMEARKSRDDAESEDKANQMRDSLKAKTDLTVDEDAVSKFQIGNDDIENIYSKVSEQKAQDLKSMSDALTQKANDMKGADAKLSAAEAKQNELLGRYKYIQEVAAQANEALTGLKDKMQELADSSFIAKKATERSEAFQNSKAKLAKMAEGYGIDIGDVSKMGIDEIAAVSSKLATDVSEWFDSKAEEVTTELSSVNKAKDEAELAYNNALKEQKAAKDAYDNALSDYNSFQASKESFRNNINSIKSAYENGEIDANKAVAMLQNMSLMADYSALGLKTADMVYLAGGLDGSYLAAKPSALQRSYEVAPLQKQLTFEPAPPDVMQFFEKAIEKAVEEEAQDLQSKPFQDTKAGEAEIVEGYGYDVVDALQLFDNAIQKAVEEGADEKTVQAMTDIATSVGQSLNDLQEAIKQNDIAAYIEAQKQYNENLNEALKIGNRLTQTDYNKDFVEGVAKANDFDVTLADGTTQKYSQFATEMATKSPEIAKAMYEAKAQKYEAENHPILAKIERAKAEMVGTWLGSKLTLADNQVRDQFNQMAKTNMRATYATYNNVLNDPNASPEAKAEAFDAIQQANSLMTASAALQASTGFLSGIGDSMKDGVYGVTDPAALNAYQKTLNTIDNFAKITLGLGVTPGANRAYQNMYYMAGAKVNESGLFSKDFDSDGFALCQEYGNNAAAGMIAGAGELATGIALFFNPATAGMGLNLTIDSIQTFLDGLYGVQRDARKSEKYTQEVLNYFKEAESIAAETGNEEALAAISDGITQIENFELKSDEVGNLDNWLEGSGSNTATNEKFNQSLSYDEWLKLIEADPTMQEYAKKLIAEKKEK